MSKPEYWSLIDDPTKNITCERQTMLFAEDDSHLLNTWLVRRLDNASDADADILADFVLALLKHDQGREQVRQLCVEQLADFLRTDTEAFVDDLFSALEHRSFISINSQLRGSTAGRLYKSRSKDNFTQEEGTDERSCSAKYVKTVDTAPKTVISKASTTENGLVPVTLEAESQISSCYSANYRAEACMLTDNSCTFETSYGGSFPVGNAGAHHSEKHPSKNNSKCGYNESCEDLDFSGSPVSINNVIGSKRNLRRDLLSFTPADGAKLTSSGLAQDGFDYNLLIENIPHRNFNELDVHAFFAQYGELVRVQLDIADKRAIVTYSSFKAANVAYTSPIPVFDNRFVKISWQYKDVKRTLQPNSKVGRASYRAVMEPKIITEKQRKHEERVQKRSIVSIKLAGLNVQRAELERKQRDQMALIELIEAKPNKALSTSSFETPQKVALRLQLNELRAKAAAMGVKPRADISYRNAQNTGFLSDGTFGRQQQHLSRTQRHRSLKLDNRTRKVAISEPTLVPVNSLKVCLSNIDYEEISDDPEDPALRIITFKDRHTAEKFVASKTVPGIGQVAVSWYQPHRNTSAITSGSTPPQGRLAEEGHMFWLDNTRDRWKD